jgi:hypothetical protein
VAAAGLKLTSDVGTRSIHETPRQGKDLGSVMGYPGALLQKYQVLQDPNENLHRTITDIVASYNSPWDPLTELVQNAVDAVNDRAKLEAPGFQGQIRITIDAASRSVTVEDNGIGMSPGSHDTMILPGGSYKRQGNTYGHKGLGFTYCAHIAEAVEVETQELGKTGTDHWQLSGGFRWLIDAGFAPTFTKASKGSIRSIKEPGTSVRMTFLIGQYEANVANTAVLDTFFDWADDSKLLPFVLRTRTALGQVHGIFGKSPTVDIATKVTFVNGNRQIDVPYQFFELDNLPPFNQQAFPLAQDYATNIYLNPKAPNKTHYGIYHVFNSDTQNPGQPLRAGKHKGGVRFAVYLFACGKKNLAEALSQYDQRLSDTFRYLSLTTDVHLAIDGMPCGVPIDSWNNYGAHEQRYFAVVNAELSFGTVLDAGRKTITRHYVDILVDKIIDMTKDGQYFAGAASFYDMSVHLHTTSALPPSRSPIAYITKWSAHPSLGATSLLLGMQPDDELGVYVLFGELVGRGLIPGYVVKYVSGGAIYDAAFEFSVDLANPSHTNGTVGGGVVKYGIGSALAHQYRKQPLYQWQDHATGRTFLIAEFKVTAEDLLRDIKVRKSEKQIKDIDMLVCLNCDQSEINRLGGALVPVNDAARRLAGVTHILSYAGQDVQVIAVADIIRELHQSGQLK